MKGVCRNKARFKQERKYMHTASEEAGDTTIFFFVTAIFSQIHNAMGTSKKAKN